MAMIRATFFFEQGKYGWSESIHNLNGTLSGAATAARDLAFKRMAMLPQSCKISYIRVSDDEVERDSQIVPFDNANFEPIVDESASAFTACLIRLEAGATHRRLIYVRPAALSEGINSDPFIDDPSWIGAYNAWKAQLITGTWGVKYRNAVGAKVPINAVSSNSNLLNVACTTTGNFFAGDSIYIGKLPEGKSAMGYYKVRTIIDANSMWVESYLGPTIDVSAGGYVQKRSFTLAAITDVIKLRVVSRKTGRPFDSPRGRSRIVR